MRDLPPSDSDAAHGRSARSRAGHPRRRGIRLRLPDEDEPRRSARPVGCGAALVTDQDEWFLRRYARAFDDLNSDLQVGRYPTPTCTAEEIALDLAIQDAERLYHDEHELVADLESDLPASRSDYDWNTLQDVLFQDKDYEGLLSDRMPLARDEAEGWFEEFGNIPPRDRRRGFRR